MRFLYFTVFTCITATVFSCSYSDDIASFKDEDINFYNKQIHAGEESNENWINSPISIVNKLILSDINKEGNPYFKVEQQQDSVNYTTIIVTIEGALDDAVNGEKRIINFRLKDGKWLMTRVRVGFKCWENRGGHTNYSGIN